MHTHVALLRGVNNLGGKKVTMAELREVVSALGHTNVVTYIQSGNVLFTPQLASCAPGRVDAEALAGELERAVADGIGVLARAVVLSREDLARAVRDNPYPGERNPRLLHAVFLPETPGPSLAAWVSNAERQVRETGSHDEATVLGRIVYLHTPDGYPRSELRRVLAKAGGPTSTRVGGTARNWATVSKLLELCRRPQSLSARLTATATATAAASRYRQPPQTAHHSRTISAGPAYATPGNWTFTQPRRNSWPATRPSRACTLSSGTGSQSSCRLAVKPLPLTTTLARRARSVPERPVVAGAPRLVMDMRMRAELDRSRLTPRPKRSRNE
jgi:uncharacterized protein (DUF1697 family)